MDFSQDAELKTSFERDGYAIIRNFVPAAEVEEICCRAEAAVQKRPNAGGKFTNVTKGLEKVDEYFDNLLHRGAHVPLLENLLGKPPEPSTASFFTKSRNSEEVHPHSDALEGGVIWIALDPTNKQNGCLHFLKGSHLKEEEFKHLSASEPTDLSAHPDLVEIAMDPGDMVIFRPTTVHWSGPNHDGSSRRGFNCFYTGNPYKNLTKEQWAALKAKKNKMAG